MEKTTRTMEIYNVGLNLFMGLSKYERDNSSLILLTPASRESAATLFYHMKMLTWNLSNIPFNQINFSSW
jgi:hypothetical protein